MKIKSQKDFFAGLVFMAMGIAFAWGATNYTIGEGARMGPGYFPLMLGLLLAAIGAGVVFEAMVVETEDGEKIGSMAWRPLGFIIGANVIFGICLGGIPKLGIPALGLMVGIYALTFTEVAILATALAVISYLAFIMLLKLQFPVWPSFLTN